MADAESPRTTPAPGSLTEDLSLAEAVRTAEVFEDLSEAVRCDLVAGMSQVLLQGDDILVRQGECTDTLFVVKAGEQAITCIDRLGRTRALNSLGPGRLLGAPGLLVRTPFSVP